MSPEQLKGEPLDQRLDLLEILDARCGPQDSGCIVGDRSINRLGKSGVIKAWSFSPTHGADQAREV